jgi:radical SAM superfamily enzyme YgiQ (UPF0313 family)
MTSAHRVLVVTGGWITGQESSLFQMVRKVWTQQRAAQDAWLDLAVKAVTGEPMLAARLEKLSLPLCRRELRETVRTVFADRANAEAPSLTEVILCTLLHRAGLAYDRMELGDLVARPAEAERKLAAASCVFLSSTYLHDLSELEPAVHRLKRPHNRIVVGGALAGILHDVWNGMPEVDILAIGYGERLIDSLAAWIRSGGQTLEPPGGGRLVRKGPTTFLYSGVPADLSLDGLPEADWELAMSDAGRQDRPFRMAYYESVRGCPYRCNFCNYPYLFDDTKFRVKSAGRIAGDWERLAALGVEHVTCLDSLFTMPRSRLRELCRLLLDRGIRIRWICYARADDLADEETVVLMKEAGAQQVQIGIESGDPVLLDNMDKACTVEANAQALVNCRRHGLTTIVSLIVGFPGETAESLERTYRFLAATPPDFYFLATFSTRVAGVPLLRPENRERFGLRVRGGLRTMSPYWEHATMSCADVSRHVRALDRRLMRDRIALNAAVFYPALLAFAPEHREPLLDFQQRVATRHPVLTTVFDAVHGWIGRRLRRAVREHFTETGPDLAPLSSGA